MELRKWNKSDDASLFSKVVSQWWRNIIVSKPRNLVCVQAFHKVSSYFGCQFRPRLLNLVCVVRTHHLGIILFRCLSYFESPLSSGTLFHIPHRYSLCLKDRTLSLIHIRGCKYLAAQCNDPVMRFFLLKHFVTGLFTHSCIVSTNNVIKYNPIGHYIILTITSAKYHGDYLTSSL